MKREIVEKVANQIEAIRSQCHALQYVADGRDKGEAIVIENIIKELLLAVSGLEQVVARERYKKALAKSKKHIKKMNVLLDEDDQELQSNRFYQNFMFELAEQDRLDH